MTSIFVCDVYLVLNLFSCAMAQEVMIDLQQRLSSSLAELQAAHHRVGMLENKAHGLEIEKKLAANAEQRLSAEVSQVPSSVKKTPRCCWSGYISSIFKIFMKVRLWSVHAASAP